jgi:phosphoserine phosphatase
VGNQQRLVILDMDSTFIRQEVIDLLAIRAGVGEEVSAITERSMRGEMDFHQSLTARTSLLAGLPDSIFDDVRLEITLSQGAERLVQVLHSLGEKIAIVSGGFENVIAPILQGVGVDYFKANLLEIDSGFLTGRIIGPVVDREAKALYLQELARELEIPLSQTVAVGDGANDLGMMEIAGLSIAFNAKPIVVQAADVAITDGDLLGVLTFMGIHLKESNSTLL